MIPLAFVFALGVVGSQLPARTPSVASAEIDAPIDPLVRHWTVAPFRAPSHEHPYGTVVVVGAVGDLARIIEWDLGADREIARKELGIDISDAVAGVEGEHLFVAMGADQDVVLVELDEALDVVERHTLGRGRRPSLAVSDKWVLASTFDGDAMHVVAIDRSSRVITGAQMFYERRGLVMPGDPSAAMRSIALRGDIAYISLPASGEVTFESARLPSFVTVKRRVIDKLGWFGSAPLAWSGADLVTTLPTGPRRLGTDFTDRPVVTNDAWTGALDQETCATKTTAWRLPVALCGTPSRLYVRR